MPPPTPTTAAKVVAAEHSLNLVKVEPVEIKLEPETESANDWPEAAAVVKRERDEPLEEGECSSSDGD